MTEKTPWLYEEEIGLAPTLMPLEDFDSFGRAVVDILILGRLGG